MASNFKPESAEDVLSFIAWAAAEHKPVSVVGGGTKSGIGRPVQTEHTLSVSDLKGITLYEPEELVLSAGAGTPLSEIEATLLENGQELAFEPPRLNDFFGLGAEAIETIGGVISANLAGPRRIRSGAARDHFLGLSVVTGRGEAIKSGGRVMKNVTGYDLCKAFAGSWGTLGVLTEVTLKVLPITETVSTLIILGLSAEMATRVMTTALGASVDVSGATHLSPAVAARSKVPRIKEAATSVTVVRIEGFPASVKARASHLEEILAQFGEVVRLTEKRSRELWIEIRDLSLLPKGKDVTIWRVSTAPTRGHEVVQAIGNTGSVDAVFDWGGGLVWLAQPTMGNGNGAAVRRVIEEKGGHATLYRAPNAVRAAVDVFQPLPAPLMALTRRLKAAFDPHGILNPNRMYAGV